jgi:hypothetical protein
MTSNKYIIKIYFMTNLNSMINASIFLINLVKLDKLEHSTVPELYHFWDVGSSFMNPNMSLPSSPRANMQK